jgi:hypothetical protein
MDLTAALVMALTLIDKIFPLPRPAQPGAAALPDDHQIQRSVAYRMAIISFLPDEIAIPLCEKLKVANELCQPITDNELEEIAYEADEIYRGKVPFPLKYGRTIGLVPAASTVQFNSIRLNPVAELHSREQRARDKSLLVKRLYPSMKKGENCSTNYDPTETKSCSKCPSRGHHEFDCFKYRRYSPTICAVCKKFNHYEDACNEWEKLPSSHQPRDTYTQLEWKADIRNVENQIQGLAVAIEKALGARETDRPYRHSRDVSRSPDRDSQRQQRSDNKQFREDRYSDQKSRDSCLSERRSYPRMIENYDEDLDDNPA